MQKLLKTYIIAHASGQLFVGFQDSVAVSDLLVSLKQSARGVSFRGTADSGVFKHITSDFEARLTLGLSSPWIY